ncbi:MAG TPA: hypothetical protein VK735_09035 [Pseudonocardia sp.]|jgi:hypothetical protein|uniref:hypothetical protein n=1 Tax=Pseudonocardia sp. TaxID=60912 RepID=UPI002C20C5B6|nr:hypothetical protein [Pseudonocardia sp.]HTF47577.1 hypothetical protein [Pseudonocardia sp.]
MRQTSAASRAAEQVRAVRDSPEGRLRLAAEFYPEDAGERGRYGRAELSFLRWAIARGVLNGRRAGRPGSPWWQAVNDRLLCDKLEVSLLRAGALGSPSSRGVELWDEFIARPSSASWYRAHNSSVARAYLEHEPLAEAELPAERFMMNVALVRVLYTHALVARPRLALGAFAPLGRLLGDPRGGTVALFLDLRRSFPAQYPLVGAVIEDLIAAEGHLPRALDYGLILPRLTELYEFAATSLEMPGITGLISEGVPCYARPAPRSVWVTGNATRLLPRLTAWATRPKSEP